MLGNGKGPSLSYFANKELGSADGLPSSGG